jgi:hypothetical protein
VTLVVALLGALFFPGAAAPQQSAENGCGFTLSRQRVEPAIVGPPELVSRAHVLAQPDSPVVILSLDLSGITVNLAGPSHNREGQFRVQVQNVSDQAVKTANVMLRYWSGTGGGGHGPAFKEPLEPGEVRWLTGGGRGNSVRPGHDMESSLELRAVVESVELADCIYRPAQAHRITR